MPYCALYRQWRPKDFSHVVGQHNIVETLRNQVINDRIAHAYLFCGSRGTGKTSTAKILARAINCEHPKNGDPCGACQNCLRMEREESLDITEIDAASNNGVDEIRDLRESVKYPPQYGKYRVYIIDEVHMLSTSAFNALLKTLEEPPAYIVFILATTEPQKLPETILSRCQRFDFGRLSVTDIQSRLREAAEYSGVSISNGALMIIARAAEGGMRDALSMLDMCLGYSSDIDEQMVRSILGTCDRSFLIDFVHQLAENETGRLFIMIDQMMRDGRDPSVFVRDVSYHLRNLLLAKCCPEGIADILDLTEEDAQECFNQAEEFTVTRLMKILDLFLKAENEMRLSSSQRLALENICLKCCIRTNETDAAALIDRISEIEKKLETISIRLDDSLSSASFKTDKKTKPIVSSTEKHAFTVAADDFDDIWKKTMTRMAKDVPSVWSMLTQGKATCKGENDIHWQPLKQQGSAFFIGPLNRDDKKSSIINCLRDITGKDYSFSADPYEETAISQDNAEKAYLEELYKTFGKEPVDIVDNLQEK